jgi:hypothetical protein
MLVKFLFLQSNYHAMAPIFKILPILLLFCSLSSVAQKKKLQTKFTNERITIDGKFTEAVWDEAAVATDFFMFEPDNGKPISKDKKTDVKIVYDNEAIYVAATLYDEDPNKILKEITQRDNFGTADLFSIFINGFNDGQQDFRFFVSAAGVQMDCIADENGEDYSWDAIWSSAVKINDAGWVVEMKIPYAALRFSKEPKQTWGLNIFREIKRDRQKYTWSLIDAKIAATIPQAGILEGIENIDPPTRLFFIPYASYYYNKNETGFKNTFKGGMDIKYGINDSFTLDAILVPDFGQTVFDNVVLNLGPFEQQFNENRPFFTEGTDLFNKGGLLYSRRIGGTPSSPLDPRNDDEEVNNPTTTNLINALKVSGRTSKGLGIGVLNAITEKTYGTRTNTVTKQSTQEVVEPLTNYNVMVLDQRFNQNSSVALVNTNVTRNAGFRDANVSALVYDLKTKDNKYFINGDVKYNYINPTGNAENYDGISTSLQLGERADKWRYNAGGFYTSDGFDTNDLGITFINNYHGIYANLSYRILNPQGIFNTFKVLTNYYGEFHNTTGRLQQGQINIDINSTTRKNDAVGMSFVISPLETHDFYESQVKNRFVVIPRYFNASFYISSNYNRTLAFDFQPFVNISDQQGRMNYGFSLDPRYRASDRLLIIYSFYSEHQDNYKGRVDFDNNANTVIFANRNRKTLINGISGKYAINPEMTLNLAARYYWSYAENDEYLTLENNGTLSPNPAYTKNRNSDFSTWNFDLSYSWWFASGSQLSILYRNNSSVFDRNINKDINTNFRNLFDGNLNTVFSISCRYFIDYNAAKKWFK